MEVRAVMGCLVMVKPTRGELLSNAWWVNYVFEGMEKPVLDENYWCVRPIGTAPVQGNPGHMELSQTQQKASYLQVRYILLT